MSDTAFSRILHYPDARTSHSPEREIAAWKSSIKFGLLPPGHPERPILSTIHRFSKEYDFTDRKTPEGISVRDVILCDSAVALGRHPPFMPMTGCPDAWIGHIKSAGKFYDDFEAFLTMAAELRGCPEKMAIASAAHEYRSAVKRQGGLVHFERPFDVPAGIVAKLGGKIFGSRPAPG